METKRCCSQETFFPPSAMLGEVHLFHYHTFLCSARSSTKSQTCHRFGGKGGILFYLGLVVRHLKKDCLPGNRGQLWKLSKCWLQGELDLWPRLSQQMQTSFPSALHLWPSMNLEEPGIRGIQPIQWWPMLMPNWSNLIKGSSCRDLIGICFFPPSFASSQKCLDSLSRHCFHFIMLTILPDLKTN